MGSNPAFVGAIDQGTTSTRFFLYDRNAKPVASHQVEFAQIYPQAGWVEHDPLVILDTVKVCIQKTCEKARAEGISIDGNVKAIGITNQRETTVVWRKSTGLPLYNAIVWMDARTSSICRRLEKELPEGRLQFVKSAGLPISTYFSAMKLIWLLESVPVVKSAIEEGDALFGTVETWLIWNLTRKLTDGQDVPQGGVHVTDCANAARTLLMDLSTLQWHEPTLKRLGIPSTILPRIVSNAEYIGDVAEGWPLAGVPIAGCIGDQHAAVLGQKCKKGEAKSTYGTGCFILMNTGETLVSSKHGLLTTISFKLGPHAPTHYALEGSIAIAGAAVQWLRDTLGIIDSAREIEALANSVENTGGLYFVPAFNGLFAPWWRDDARGVLIGISRFTSKAHVARAVLESLCFQAKDVLSSMQSDASSNTSEFVLRVDGGASANNLMLQLQADLLGSTVIRPADIETTARGAAYVAGLTIGWWTEQQIFEDISLSVTRDGHPEAKVTTFHPRIGKDEREKRHALWCKAVQRSFGLAGLS
ncbi:hypothetical protein O6H91_11G009000 [Diphasiastrum complanatum]|uniref:Uncharacterized protein n=2 Tax=Diphasiastrum complanatum TaxID=34168 RepID=A0ACC2C672_DIPCM|nr:hypothetical protein O6H91_18G000200 [Diphasiastrum complanatum]KAJ7537513.1 hypothetical protein O6H91_11G009000 [Diphasiastrum complanatum]